MKKRMMFLSVLALLSLVVAAGSFAADYPTKPLTLINPMPPGGSLDVQARAFAAVADKILGQPVVVVNKPGATGMIGAAAGAQAAPDGYTLTVGSVNIPNALEWEIANGRKPAFSRNDFVPIGAFTMSPMLLVVNAEAPYKNLADFLADAKARPGQLAYSSGGLYGMSHLPGIIFEKASGMKFRHVPSGGGGPALTAVVSKHVDFNFPSPPTALPLIRGNKIKALAVISGRRLKSAPDVPTAKELGINAEYYAWVGLLAPAKTPKPVVDKLRDALKKVTDNKTFIEMIEGPGDEVQYLGGDGLAKHMVSESAMVAGLYRELIKEGAK
jgi:tripartite-type tricarboxylate transporter receptor subunit TctC